MSSSRTYTEFDEVSLPHLPFSTGFKHCRRTPVQPLNFLYFWAIACFLIGFKPVSSMLPGETKAGQLKDQPPDKKLRKIEDKEEVMSDVTEIELKDQ